MFESIRNDSKARTLSAVRVEAKRLFTCEQLLQQKRKGFLHCIVTGHDKWIHYDNPKRRRSWDKPGHASTSSAKSNIQDSKFLLCIWWALAGVVYYELVKANEIITGDRCN